MRHLADPVTDARRAVFRAINCVDRLQDTNRPGTTVRDAADHARSLLTEAYHTLDALRTEEATR